MTMDNDLKFHLQNGGTSVKELARLTGKSTSALYKALKGDNIITVDGPDGAKLFSMQPDEQEAVEDGPAATDRVEPVETPTAAANAAPTQPLAVTEREPVNYDPAAAPVLARRGRKPTAEGKRLTANVNANERRANTHGYRSLQIILDNPGIKTEDFLAKGGRLNDLRWDIARNRVRAEG